MSNMPHEKVNDSFKLAEFIASLHLSQRLSDVTIKVPGQVFRAHSVFLGGQSPYFENKFFNQGMKEVTLYLTTAAVFRDVLGYFYTGQLRFQTDDRDYMLNLLELTKLLELQSLRERVLCAIGVELLTDEPLAEDVLEFYDKEAQLLISTKVFKKLPLNRLQQLLSRDTFYVENELGIFKAVMEWGKGRPGDERKAGLSQVRLSLISHPSLLSDVKQTGAFTDTEIMDVLILQSDSPDSLAHRIPSVDTGPEINVATPARAAKVLSGANPEHLLDQGDHVYSATSGFTSHTIKAQCEQEGIVVKLGTVYNINTIRLHLLDKGPQLKLWSYYVEVSTKRAGPWQRVVDHIEYHCRGHQLLQFDPTRVQYVRLVGTSCTTGDVFAVVSLQCCFTDTPLPVTQGLIEPRENQATVSRGVAVIEASNNCGSMLNAVRDDEEWTGGQTITVVSPQPVCIESLRFKLWHEYEFRYTLEVSTDGTTWRQVADKTETACKSWQLLKFQKTPVSYLRFCCTNSSIDTGCMYISCLEYPAQTI